MYSTIPVAVSALACRALTSIQALSLASIAAFREGWLHGGTAAQAAASAAGGGGGDVHALPVHIAVVCDYGRVVAGPDDRRGTAARTTHAVVVGQAAAAGVEGQPVGVPGKTETCLGTRSLRLRTVDGWIGSDGAERWPYECGWGVCLVGRGAGGTCP
ncbi:hypothetical protein ON010_g10230 [Phytophthora cinnamomi]|nr:hypothetical protein ON010_g10230 [Phytophthora cinnamomi]